MKLTRENYYSAEADREYWSCSQYQDFERCEAAALAKIDGRWEEEPTEALLAGNYLHTALESPEAHAAFIATNEPQIYTKQGKLRAPFEQAEKMLSALREDDFIAEWINRPGDVEKIITGRLFGRYPWKIRLDKYFPHERKPIIVDWKTAADIHRLDWNETTRQRESFVRAYGYLMRAAVYLEIEKQRAGRETDAEFFLVAVSKQDPPDKAIIALTGSSRQELDYELERIKRKIEYFDAIKSRRIPAKRCERCAYCRSTKQMSASKILHYTELDGPVIDEQEARYE